MESNLNKIFGVGTYSQNGYNFTVFTVWNKYQQFNEQKLEIEFQGGGTADLDLKNYWYGVKYIVKSSNPEDFIFTGNLAKKLNLRYDIQPIELVEKLEKLGYQRIAYHNGLNGFQPINKWPEGETFTTFTSDNQLYKRVVAKSERDAVKKFLKICSKEIENGYNTVKWGEWLKEQKVYKVSDQELPIYIDLTKIPA